MEQPPNHPPPSSRSNTLSVNISKKTRSSALGVPPGFEAVRRSDDTGLFSSSLPVLRHAKLNFTDSEHGVRSNDDAASFKLNSLVNDVEDKDCIGDFDLDGVGSLLPEEDEFFAGMMDDFDLTGLTSQVEQLEECDLFGSGGGMELDFDSTESLTVAMGKTCLSDAYLANGPNGVGTIAGEHPYGEHPSRTLFVRNINSNVEDSELQSLFEQYGDIRTLYTACKHRGFVMISYYDIRAARTAMRTLQNKPLRRRKLDIHFSIPKDNPSEKDINQGTLVVFNLDPSVSNDDLRQIFGAYGEVKEIRETPHKRHHKFIEYYDVRAAEAALRALNRSDIAGKRIKLEPSRPGGARRNIMQHLNQELEHEETRSYGHQAGSPIMSSPPGSWSHHVGSPIINSPPGSWVHASSPSDSSSLRAFNHSPNFKAASPIIGNNLPGLASILPPRMPNSLKIAPIGREHNRINDGDRLFSNSSISGGPFQSSHSFTERNNGITHNMSSSPGTSFAPNSGGSDFGTLSGNQFLWGSPNPYTGNTSSLAWPTSSTGHHFISNGQAKGFPYASQGAYISSAQHHVGSAPSGMPFERRFTNISDSPDLSFMDPVGFGSMGSVGRNEGIPMGIGARGPMNYGLALPGDISENSSLGFRMISSQRLGNMFHGSNSFAGSGSNGNEGLVERARSRRADSNGLDTKKQYQLDLERIVTGEDMRTTLMIKNIPNKYTSKMLLAAIDENHKGTYDFVYLPIDFKAFNGKKWEKFNSEKVASLAYARIQGLDALIAHFQNSSLMNEDKRCRPIIFHSEGPTSTEKDTFPPIGAVLCDYQQNRAPVFTSHGSPTNGSDEKVEIC